MILVEVMVPSLGRRYDFELEETVPVEVLTREMIAVICQKEHCQCFEKEQPLALYSQERQCLLSPQGTLRQSAMVSGDCLILV